MAESFERYAAAGDQLTSEARSTIREALSEMPYDVRKALIRRVARASSPPPIRGDENAADVLRDLGPELGSLILVCFMMPLHESLIEDERREQANRQ